MPVLLILAVLRPAHAGERPRVAVLPFTAMAVPGSECKKLRGHLTELLNNLFDVQLVEGQTTNRNVRRFCGKPAAWWDCLGKDESLFKLGARLKAEVVVVGRLAAIGKRRVLKLRLADVASGRVSAEVVNIPAGQEEAVLSRFVLLHKQWFGGRPPPPPQARPDQPPTAPAAQAATAAWYQKWETWTIVGAGVLVAAGAVLLATMYSPDSASGPWDYYRTLP